MPKGRVINPNEGSKYGYTEEEWQSFHRSKRSRIRHPEHQAIAYKKWAAKQTPEYHRARMRTSQLKLQYGMTNEEYEVMLMGQDNACAICTTKTPTGKWKVFAVDHCHKTGQVRGLLCNECNRGMGLLRDSAFLLRKAADYLDKTKTQKEKKTRASK